MQTALQRVFKAPILLALEYGSAAFSQKSYSSAERKLLDLIFVVHDPIEWHRENFKTNPHHYSFIARQLPFSCWKGIQNYGAGLWYNLDVDINVTHESGIHPQFSNTNVLLELPKHEQCPIRNFPLIKYGITSLSNFTDDLNHWRTLYLAGRLHKPVRKALFTGTEEENALIDDSINQNRQFALNAALQMLPTRFTIEELLQTIVSISYLGDFRMKIGENPDKIKNIVDGQFDELLAIYRPTLMEEHGIAFTEATGIINQDLGTTYPLPAGFNGLRGGQLRETIIMRSAMAALKQSIKGLVTANVTNAFCYGWKKIKKQFKKV